MHRRPTLGPRRVDLLVITADEFVVGVAAAEDRLQLLRLLSAERRLRADSEEGVQEERELQRRVVLLLLRQLWRLLKGFRGGGARRRPQQSREGGGVVLLRQRRRLRLLIAEAAVEAELQKRI